MIQKQTNSDKTKKSPIVIALVASLGLLYAPGVLVAVETCSGISTADPSLNCWGCGNGTYGPNIACTGGVVNNPPSCGPGWCVGYTAGPCGTACPGGGNPMNFNCQGVI